jgi:hypothetical protein
MKRRQAFVLVVTLVAMATAAIFLARLKTHRHLGAPGVKTEPIPGSVRLKAVLPARVLDYTSEEIETDKMVLEVLPKDTSFGQRHYKAADGFWANLNVVLMGSDRTSLHKPQFCLIGAGWRIDQTENVTVRIPRPQPYDLPVTKLTTSREVMDNGQVRTWRGVYAYWFVCDGAISGEDSGGQRMWWMARELLRTGVLQRWAYVTCFAACPPGQEDATFKRMEKFLAAAVPEFQLVSKPANSAQGAGSR